MTYSPEGMRLTDEGIDQEGIQNAEGSNDASEQNDFNFDYDTSMSEAFQKGIDLLNKIDPVSIKVLQEMAEQHAGEGVEVEIVSE